MATRLSSKRSGSAARFEPLNLIPIMNLFIVIIPMLLMITVSVHLTLLSLNLMAAGSGTGGTGEGTGTRVEDSIKVVLVIYPNRFEIQEGSNAPVTITAVEQESSYKFDYYALDAALRVIKERNPDIYTISVTPYDEVIYDTLVRAIDVSKFTGFTEVKYERVRVGAI